MPPKVLEARMEGQKCPLCPVSCPPCDLSKMRGLFINDVKKNPPYLNVNPISVLEPTAGAIARVAGGWLLSWVLNISKA